MGTLTFRLPPSLPEDTVRELKRSCLAGGPDCMPWVTSLRLDRDQLCLEKGSDESGYLMAPWSLEEHGQLMITSATLTERHHPYTLLVELARGKINQVRNQAADWREGGLQIPATFQDQINQAIKTFGQATLSQAPVVKPDGALAETPPATLTAEAVQALRQGHGAADRLARLYAEQVFHIRHQRQQQLDTLFSCNLTGTAPPADEESDAFAKAFNSVNVPLSWHVIEANEANYNWESYDSLLAWAEERDLPILAGPLIDFSPTHLPSWLWTWERDQSSMVTFICRFIEAAVRRYRGRIQQWQLTGASNWANVLNLKEEELLGLTYRICDTAYQADPSLHLVLGTSQPWGDYLAQQHRNHSPFLFADWLIRSGLQLSTLDVEVIMGVSPRGSYCRDLLDLSRMLDLYALLGLPLQVTLGYPSVNEPDPEADPELAVGAGHWNGYTLESQANWTDSFTTLCLAKPYVKSVRWCHWSDADRHQFPHCGLVDSAGNRKPALDKLQSARQKHLH
jgi:GH35 family endo-1,4-beta-xylanase